MSRALLAALAVAAVIRRRRSRRARVGLYFSDGLLVALPTASPAALQLRAAAGDVLRAFSAAGAPASSEAES
jgi:hypothetical protein